MAICTEESYYVLRFDRDAYDTYIEENGEEAVGDEGVEEAFEVVGEINEG